MKDFIIAEDETVFPVVTKAARLRILDPASPNPVFGDEIAYFERWHLDPSSAGGLRTCRLDWRTLWNQAPTGLLSISEAGPDQGRLIVGDSYGHVTVFDATSDRYQQPVWLARSPALLGTVGVDGFLYRQDIESGDRTLTFSGSQGTWRMRFSDSRRDYASGSWHRRPIATAKSSRSVSSVCRIW